MRVAVEDAQVKRQHQQHKAGDAGIEPPVLGKREEEDIHCRVPLAQKKRPFARMPQKVSIRGRVPSALAHRTTWQTVIVLTAAPELA